MEGVVKEQVVRSVKVRSGDGGWGVEDREEEEKKEEVPVNGQAKGYPKLGMRTYTIHRGSPLFSIIIVCCEVRICESGGR